MAFSELLLERRDVTAEGPERGASLDLIRDVEVGEELGDRDGL
jgi:hypothetical protein